MILRAALFFLLATPAVAVDCRNITFEDTSYSVCEVAAGEDLRLFHSDDQGELLGGFGSLQDHVAPDRLAFAMNAGMYREDRSPAGLYVADGETKQALVTKDGPGNFGLLPNGVFCIADTLSVVETLRFDREQPVCDYATQSGPMLVINGSLHPRFIDGGTSLHIRNGVGTTEDGTRAFFAISNEPVNFHTFGRLFKDHLGTPNALYLDGSVSRLYAPELGRNDIGFLPLGPLVGVIKTLQSN